MARLKTLKDAAAASEPVADAPVVDGVSTSLDTNGQGEPASAEPVADDVSTSAGTTVESVDQPATAPESEPSAAATTTAEGAGAQQAPSPDTAPADAGTADELQAVDADLIAEAQAAADAAHARVDEVQGEYLAQSNKLAAANARISSLEDEVKAKQGEIEALTKAVAERDVQIAALGSEPPPLPAEYAVHRPAAGDVLTLPADGEAPAEDAMAYLDAGELLVMVLADDNGVVQPFPPAIGGKAMFTPQGTSLLYAPLIQLEPEAELVTVRFAVLLDDDGHVLSTCRLGALLIGGGGLSAMIPGNNLRFNFG